MLRNERQFWIIIPLLFLIPAAPLPAQAPELAAMANKERTAIQKEVANAKDATAILNRLRIDGFEAAGDAVKVAGVFLRATGDVDSIAIEDESLDAKLRPVIESSTKTEKFPLDLSGIVRIELKDLPEVLVHAAAEKAKIDELLLDPSRFGADGTLELRGRVSSDAHKWLETATKSTLEKHAAAGKLAVNTAKVKSLTAWPLGVRALQKALASSRYPALQRVRIDRVIFRWEIGVASATRRMIVSGIAIGEDPVEAVLLAETCRKISPDFPWNDAPRLTEDFSAFQETSVRFPEPIAQLRKAFAQLPEYDGVRIDPGMRFTEEGQLAVGGVVPNVSAEYRSKLNQVLAEQVAKLGEVPNKEPANLAALATRGAVAQTDRLRVFESQRLLNDLRSWVNDSLDDTTLSRLNFNEAGKLVLTGRFAREKDDQRIQAESQRKLLAEMQRSKAKAAFETEFQLTKLPASLTDELRKLSAADAEASQGLHLERGYFNIANQYVLRGAAQTPEQIDIVKKLLNAEKAKPEWADFFRNGAAPIDMELLPLETLLTKFQRIAPGYPQLDWLAFQKFEQAPLQPLTLTVVDEGNPSLKRAESQILELLRDHPGWKKRASAGLKIVAKKPEAKQNIDAKAFSFPTLAKILGRGRIADALPLIEQARTHYPDRSASWYLSGIYHQMLGDNTLAKRDFFRADALEGEYPSEGNTDRSEERLYRLQVLEPIQGPAREAARTLFEQVHQEALEGKKPPTLRDE